MGNPLSWLGDLLGTGVNELKYGPNFKDRIAHAQRLRDMNDRQLSANTSILESKARDAGSPDVFKALSKVPKRPATADEDGAFPGPGNTFWKVLSREEQDAASAKTAQAKSAGANTFDPASETDYRAQNLLHRDRGVDMGSQTAKEIAEAGRNAAADRQRYGLDHRRDRMQLGSDAAGGVVRVNMDTMAVTPVGGVRKTAPSLGERQASTDLGGILSDIDQISGVVKDHPEAVGPWSQAKLAVTNYTGGGDPNALLIQTKVYEGLVSRLHTISGAAVAPSEAKRLMKTMPSPSLESNAFTQRLSLWKEDLQNSMKAFKVTSGSIGTGGAASPGASPGGFDVNAFIQQGYK